MYIYRLFPIMLENFPDILVFYARQEYLLLSPITLVILYNYEEASLGDFQRPVT